MTESGPHRFGSCGRTSLCLQDLESITYIHTFAVPFDGCGDPLVLSMKLLQLGDVAICPLQLHLHIRYRVQPPESDVCVDPLSFSIQRLQLVHKLYNVSLARLDPLLFQTDEVLEAGNVLLHAGNESRGAFCVNAFMVEARGLGPQRVPISRYDKVLHLALDFMQIARDFVCRLAQCFAGDLCMCRVFR
ncbi:hypothetical protein BJV82DRAFT_592890 [Fennellomyces sp. T-0311]|nr:hypothetical protein BJV82DRAFT_592890 [Fennellomyces sp. T-0311]